MLKCDYCGRENADETQACSGCGTSLVQGARAAAGGPQKRWKPSAGSALDLAVGVAGLLAGHGPAVVDLVKGVLDPDKEDPDSPHSLLESAARLEGVDA